MIMLWLIYFKSLNCLSANIVHSLSVVIGFSDSVEKNLNMKIRPVYRRKGEGRERRGV